MADVELDTPIGIFGIPAGLMFDERPLIAYMRLSPHVPGGWDWWQLVPVVNVPVPQAPDGVTCVDGSWSVPRFHLVTDPDDVRGVVTAQAGVNGDYVRDLADTITDGVAPWGPLLLAQIGEGLWVMDGNHRTAAAALTHTATHPARVVNVDLLMSCPCGWTAQTPGQWAAHPCPQLTPSEAHT